MANTEQAAEAVEQPEVEAPEVEADEAAEQPAHRFETFEATRPDGTVVVIERNIDTGEQTVTEKD